jgi:tetratricopeptide (TPR) repeat protein
MFRRLPIATALFISISYCSLPAHPAQSQLEKNIEYGQKAFDQTSYAKAQRYWKKAQLEMQKSAPDEKLAKLTEQLGQAYYQDGKFPDAETQYKQCLELTKNLNLDQTAINAKMAELNAKYRSIDLNSFDETATKFSQTVGCLNACALNQEPNHHVDINLAKRFQQKLKELADSFLPKNPDGTTAVPPDLEKAATGNGGPEVKQLRLDKKITFDLVNENNGNIHLANIQGISFDVGLWAKLKELVLMQNANGPEAEITAGAFGVEKKVKTSLPQSIFDRMKEGIAKFDPFSGQQSASANASTDSTNAVTGNNPGTASGSNATDEPTMPPIAPSIPPSAIVTPPGMPPQN